MALFDVSITNTPATPYFSSSSSSSPSSSSSSHFSPSNKQQKQINNRSNSPNSDHYDTPWEFKNRTLAAILGNQRLEQQQQLKNLEKQIEEKNTKNNEVNSPNSKNNNQRILNNEKEKYESEATIAIRKRLSFQGNSQKQKEELKIKNSSKQPIRQQISPKYFQNNKLANSLLEDNTKNGNQFNSNPQPNNSIKLKNDCSSKNNKESPPPLPAHKNNLQKQNSSKFPSKTPLSPIKSNLSSNNQNLIKFGDKQQQKQNLLDTQKEKTNCLRPITSWKSREEQSVL